jgi:hypothetical protein
MTLQAREKLQEDFEDGVLPLSRRTGRERQSSQSGARRPRNFFPTKASIFLQGIFRISAKCTGSES